MRPPLEDPKLCREWFEDLWLDVCRLRERYTLPVRTRWWENPLQVETLAALAAWVERYDSGEWDDPPGKLALLYDLERVAGMLRDGNDPFHPDRDRPAFKQFLAMLSGQHDRDGDQQEE
ncbi:MAG TPA: hypothetical protein VG293_05115 [Solirubrobacteraceae bacterium]|jgi:hypothetical protein|nr:hypothetical protein [Solirubrobacteraceae bacterium]